MTSLFDDPNKDYLTELVGEGKKYRDPQALARSRIEADNFIEQLKQENAELRGTTTQQRDQLSTISRLEDLIKNLETRGNPQEPSGTSQRETTTYKPEDIESIVEQKLSARERQRKNEDNFKLVKSKLTEFFGDNYVTNVSNKIEELGITKEEFDDMSKTHPQMLFKALGMENNQSQNYQGIPRNNPNTFTPKGPEAHTYSWWQAQKLSDPKLFKDNSKLKQMEKDAQDLGEAFFDDGEPLRGDLFR